MGQTGEFTASSLMGRQAASCQFIDSHHETRAIDPPLKIFFIIERSSSSFTGL